MDNIDKYRKQQGLKSADESTRKKAFLDTMKEIDKMNEKLKIDHKDVFGNYHIYD